MKRAPSIIFASIFSLLATEQAAADNAGAAFVGGMIGGAIGSAIVNSKKRAPGTTKKSSSANRAKAKAPSASAAAAPSWNSAASLEGFMSITNNQGVSFTYDYSGQPVLVITPSSIIPPATLNTMTPVSVSVDGKPFGIVQAEVKADGLRVNDVQVLALEQRLKPARKLEIASLFATWTVSLAGFTKATEQLSMFRQQQIVIASNAINQQQNTAQAELTQAATQATSTITQNTQATTENTEAVVANTQATDDVVQSLEQNTSATQQVATVVASAAVMSAEKADQMNLRIADLSAQIATLNKVLGEQTKLKEQTADPEVIPSIEQTIIAINLRIEILQKEYTQIDIVFSDYLTSIKPNDRDLYLTARKASQLYPKVPYYIPGTNEIGEFWVEPRITDAGELMFNFRLIDPAAENDTTRSLINMNLDQLEQSQNALFKLHKNSVIAHEKKIRENYTKRVICFPTDQCPEERQKGEKGKTSTEVVFMIYEDGSTGGRLQQNKGAFQEGVNFSIDSALLLQAYLAHVVKEAKLEFESGTRTQKQLDEMFQ